MGCQKTLADSYRGQAVRTLCVQEVGYGHRMRAISDVGRLEDLLEMRLGFDAHVLLPESLCLLLEVGVLLRHRQRKNRDMMQAFNPACKQADANRNAQRDDLQAVLTEEPS
jgi:hypothetical protein